MIINYDPETIKNWVLPTVNIPKDNDSCEHAFPIWMVVPPQGCTVTCPICRKPRFIQGGQITC